MLRKHGSGVIVSSILNIALSYFGNVWHILVVAKFVVVKQYVGIAIYLWCFLLDVKISVGLVWIVLEFWNSIFSFLLPHFTLLFLISIVWSKHVLERGKPKERCKIISKLTGKIVQMSQHKYASNVVEKCLEHADTAERELLVNEILGERDVNDNLLVSRMKVYIMQAVLTILIFSQKIHLTPSIRKSWVCLECRLKWCLSWSKESEMNRMSRVLDRWQNFSGWEKITNAEALLWKFGLIHR